MEMGKFNSDDQYTYYCGQDSLRRNGVALIVNKRVGWSEFPCPPPGDLPDPGIEPESLMSPALTGRFFD